MHGAEDTEAKSEIPEVVTKFAFDVEHMDLNTLHPIYKRHLSACWDLQQVWGTYANANISSGKARELTSVVIDRHIKDLGHDFWEGGPVMSVFSKM